jgi:hypothetical protein
LTLTGPEKNPTKRVRGNKTPHKKQKKQTSKKTSPTRLIVWAPEHKKGPRQKTLKQRERDKQNQERRQCPDFAKEDSSDKHIPNQADCVGPCTQNKIDDEKRFV